MSDALTSVGDELDQLADRPLDEHPDVLERLHDALADELDRTG